jgi:hypothetical protein
LGCRRFFCKHGGAQRQMESPFQPSRELSRFKKDCLQLWGAPSGSRFEDHYRRIRLESRQHEAAPRATRLVAAFMLCAIGLCLIFLPLIYIPFLVGGAVLAASESRKIARYLDKGESRVRRAWAIMMRRHECSGRTAALAAGALAAIGLILTWCEW